MSHHRIAAKLFSEPWCIRPESLIAMCDQFTAASSSSLPLITDHRSLITSADCGDDDCEPEDLPSLETYGGLALIRIHGTLGRHLSSLETMCGGYDVAALTSQIEQLTNDPSIRALVFDIRSPGGQVSGIQTVVSAIEAFRATGRKAYAYTSDTCASAAYWIAAACDEIHAERSAVVGSISTIIAGVDDSRQWNMNGLERKVFATGKFKATGMSGKPWTADEEANIWEKVQSIDADFKSYITARRGLTDDDMQGQWWLAQYAPAGLIDSTAFTCLDELIESIFVISQ